MDLKTSCKFYSHAGPAWEAMLADCKTAERSIYLEQYIFYPGGIGQRFMDVFMEKALAGLSVRLLLDSVGSWTLMNNTKLVKKLTAAGVQLRWYNRVLPYFLHKAGSYFFRNHRKILIVDDKIAHVGGLNISQFMYNWRDTHARLEGPIVQTIKSSAKKLWYKSKISIPHLLNRFNPELLNNNDEFKFLPNSPAPGKRYVYTAILKAFRVARERIWITVPYFVPNLRLFHSLRRAVRRGVDVRIILPIKSDLPVLDLAAHSYYGMALRSGIKLYTYLPSVLHAKVMICDDVWATFGSMNMDNMSFNFNLEANIITSDSSTIQSLSNQFEQDLSVSKPIELNEWSNRPLTQKVKELILWPLHFLL